MSVLLRFVVSLSLVLMISSGVNCGSPCPLRTMIYPCHCTSVPLTKKLDFTIVTCRHLPQKSVLESIFGTLRSMQIDRFVLYDSFWEADMLETGISEKQMKLPPNWISLLRIKELEIIDSKLSSCFACDIPSGCPNLVPTKISIYNSSSDETICTLCQVSGKTMSWMACIPKLKEFHFVGNKLKTIPKDFFPTPMKELAVVNMSCNQISAIETNAFENVMMLQRLDLSHNMISDITAGIFGNTHNVLTHLDLSFNFIKRITPDILKMNPSLVSFMVQNNLLQKLPEDDWKHLSEKIRTIDLRDNPVICDCHIIWINCTLKVHANVLGNCMNEGYENTPFRRASKYMSERCVDGVITDRVNKTKLNACLDYNKTMQHETLISSHHNSMSMFLVPDSLRTNKYQHPPNAMRRRQKRDIP